MNPDDLDAVEDERIESELLDRPIASLRDLEYTYGALYELSFDADDPYLPYYTPYEFAEYAGEAETVIAVHVDAVEETVVEDDLTVRPYDEDLVSKVAHIRSDGSRDMDHSVTHQSSQSVTPSKLADTYANNRLTRWPRDDQIQEFLDDDPEDGWIIEAVERVGRDADEVDRASRLVERSVTGSNPALVTLRVRTEPGGEFRWPGEIDVLKRAAKFRWSEKQSRKNVKDSNPAARGDGVGQVVGDDAGMLVGTASDPLNYFRSKQREKFPGVDRRDAWLSHPVSEETTARIQNATGFVESCFHSTFGFRAYHLPYFPGEMDADDARALYGLLVRTLEADEENPLVQVYRNDHVDETELRFYTIALEYYQKDTYRVFHDDPAGSVLPLADLAAAHDDVVQSGLFGDDDASPFRSYDGHHSPVERDDSDRLSLVDERNTEPVWYAAIASGQYVFETFPDPLADSDDDITADDPRIVAYRSLLRGEPLDYRFLLDQFLSVVEDEERNPDVAGFPSHTVAQQFAQLCALDHEDLLDYDAFPDVDSLFPTPMSETDPETEPNRIEKLNDFVENAPVLRESTPREATFLAGVAIGRMSKYQSSSAGADVSRTLRDKYPVNRMTEDRLKEAVTALVDRNNVYSSRNDRRLMYSDVLDRLREALLDEPVEEWDVSKSDLRYFYGLGLTYGLTDESSSDYDAAEDAGTAPETTDD